MKAPSWADPHAACPAQVEKALDAPLPEDWVEHTDCGGVSFYYNTADGASSWDHPLARPPGASVQRCSHLALAPPP